MISYIDFKKRLQTIQLNIKLLLFVLNHIQIMEWIEIIGRPSVPRSSIKKIQKFTLYDHNNITKISPQDETFRCVINCKKMNRIYSSVATIDGDLKIGKINIECRLMDQTGLIHGKWQYQKVELARLAFRYNQRSYRNIFIKTNPLNGEVSVTLSFLTGQEIIEDQHKFRQIMTDLCHIVGEESEMIFNTMLQIIFGREANEPYLKSAIKVNPGFPRYMKVQKLLDKIKSLIATSSFYKIRSDISSAHKNRSYFKKIYLNQDKKLVTNYKASQLALLFQPKYSKKYVQTDKKNRDRPLQFIKDYVQLQQKNQIQFAKHLNQGLQKQKDFNLPSLQSDTIQQCQYDELSKSYIIQLSNQTVARFTAINMSQQTFAHQIQILNKISKKHSNMFVHFVPTNPPNGLTLTMFYLYEQQIPLISFLNKNSKTISLSTKLFIMSQICSFMQHLHKLNIIYYIELENIFITRGLQIKIRGFKNSYQVTNWVELNKKESQQKNSNNANKPYVPNISLLFIDKTEFIHFPYRYIEEIDLQNERSDVLSLGACLYKILMEKYPFEEKGTFLSQINWNKQQWLKMWTLQTEYFLRKGGEIVKMIGYLLLKCMDIYDLSNRPYVEWLQVIICEVRTSLNGLY